MRQTFNKMNNDIENLILQLLHPLEIRQSEIQKHKHKHKKIARMFNSTKAKAKEKANNPTEKIQDEIKKQENYNNNDIHDSDDSINVNNIKNINSDKIDKIGYDIDIEMRQCCQMLFFADYTYEYTRKTYHWLCVPCYYNLLYKRMINSEKFGINKQFEIGVILAKLRRKAITITKFREYAINLDFDDIDQDVDSQSESDVESSCTESSTHLQSPAPQALESD